MLSGISLYTEFDSMLSLPLSPGMIDSIYGQGGNLSVKFGMLSIGFAFAHRKGNKGRAFLLPFLVNLFLLFPSQLEKKSRNLPERKKKK
jgi:hypothetical protein